MKIFIQQKMTYVLVAKSCFEYARVFFCCSVFFRFIWWYFTLFSFFSSQNSLTFPEEPKTSMEKEAHHLIKSLLTEMDKRLAYDGILQHPFFGQTDWDHLLDGEKRRDTFLRDCSC